jgi:hypothetical protein
MASCIRDASKLGGGTNINRALSYCQPIIERPEQTTLVLVSDLREGGVRGNPLKCAASMIGSGVQVLALSDDRVPMYDHENASDLAALGSPAFACTPDMFPDLMAAAISRRDIATVGHERGNRRCRCAGQMRRPSQTTDARRCIESPTSLVRP